MKKIIYTLSKIILLFVLISGILLFAAYIYLHNRLPSITALNKINLSEPLRIYDQNGKLLAEFGEKKRIFTPFEQIPQQLKDAVVAIEDRRFYSHSGIDPRGILRAIYVMIKTGKRSQGASTLTQQVARNFYLSSEKTFTRKAKEIVLAIEIEKQLSKDQILELYLNNSFLGNRAYGVAAAAKVYFNKTLDQLTLSEGAVIAGLNQSPSYTNPIRSIERTTVRRNHVLSAMLRNGYITREQYEQARAEPIIVDRGPLVERVGAYASEIARAEMVKKYGEGVYESGYKVYTTINYDEQNAAEQSFRQQLIAYDRRHGWHGPTARLWKNNEAELNKDQIIKKISNYYDFGVIFPIAIVQSNTNSAYAVDATGKEYNLGIDSIKWARKFIDDNNRGPTPTKVNDILKVGDVVYLQAINEKNKATRYEVATIPQVNGGLVSLNSNDGAIKALVGGFSFQLSPFNRVLQSVVQVGSTIKPFVYSAAIDNTGISLGSIVNDAPITIKVNNDFWQPRNYGDKFSGYMTIRQGLAQSKNSIAVRLSREVGINYIGDYLQRFGFNPKDYQITESLVLGTPSFAPITIARAYATFDNGGYLIQPYIISYVTDRDDHIIYQANPEIACPSCFNSKNTYLDQIANLKEQKSDAEKATADYSFFNMQRLGNFYPVASNNDTHINYDDNQPIKQAPRIIDPNVAWLMNTALASNIAGGPGYRGTGAAALILNRPDIGGKTGTTNDNKSAWFSGYGAGQTTVVYTAFDSNSRELGKYETGGSLPLHIWIGYMRQHLGNYEVTMLPRPPGIVEIKIDNKTGLISDNDNSYIEYFIKGTEPVQREDSLDNSVPSLNDVFKSTN